MHRNALCGISLLSARFTIAKKEKLPCDALCAAGEPFSFYVPSSLPQVP